jgi:hypothetical protein
MRSEPRQLTRSGTSWDDRTLFVLFVLGILATSTLDALLVWGLESLLGSR